MMNADQKFNLAGTIVVSLATLLAIYMTKDIFIPFLLGFLLAYVFYPVYKWLFNRTHRESTSSFLTMLLILCIVLLPTFGFIGVLLQEISHLVDLGGLSYIQGMASTLLDTFRSFVENYLPAQFAHRVEAIGDISRDVLLTIAPIIQEGFINFASNVPLYVTEALVAAFFAYYFLIDGKRLIDRAVLLMPKREVTARFLRELDAIYSSLFRLFFAMAGIIAVSGQLATSFWVFHIPPFWEYSQASHLLYRWSAQPSSLVPLPSTLSSSRTILGPLQRSSSESYSSQCYRGTSSFLSSPNGQHPSIL